MHSLYVTIAVLALASACGGGVKPAPDPGPDPIPDPEPVVTHDARAWITTADKSQLFNEIGIDFGKPATMSPYIVRLDPDTRYQTIDGFGAAMTWASCYNLMKMKPEDRTDLLKELFDPEAGLGIGLIRVSIGASDFNYEEYTWCDSEGISHFAVDSRDESIVFPVLKEIYAINPDVRIIGSPWSVPRWMKMGVNGSGKHDSWTSGRLDPKHYGAYAEYFVKWIQAMQSQGFKVEAITIQNEPLNHGNSMSTYMPWEDQTAFIKCNLGAALRDAGLSTKILVYDHNYNYDGVAGQDSYPLHIFSDPDASGYVAGSAWHNYGGSVTELDKIHEAAPEKEIYFTEASIGEWNYNFASCLIDDFKSIFMQTLERYNKGVTLWNMVLDDKKGPYSPQAGSCKTCYGAVEVSSSTYKVIDRKTHYYNIAHTSKVIRYGAVRIGTSGYSKSGIMYQAYLNPDGSYAIIILNEGGSEQQLVFTTDAHSVKITVPAKAIASILF